MSEELATAFLEAIKTLTPREQDVVSRLWGINGQDKQSRIEVAEHLEITPERVRQIEAKAKRKLRHPERTKIYRKYIQEYHNVIRCAVDVLVYF